MVPVWFLLIFITCAALSLLLCYVAKTLFPRFRSGEFKPGLHRADLQPGFHRSDLPASGREIKTIELPLVGGPAIILSLITTGIAAGFLQKFPSPPRPCLLCLVDRHRTHYKCNCQRHLALGRF